MESPETPWCSRSDRTTEVGALDRLLALESFDPTELPVLYRQMITFRGQAERLGHNVERFVTLKMRARDYMRTVTRLPTLIYDDPDSGPAFHVPIDRLLRDPELESLLKEVYERPQLRRVWSEGLRALADSIATSVSNS